MSTDAVNGSLNNRARIDGTISTRGQITGTLGVGSYTGTTDYNKLRNRPMLNGIVIEGDHDEAWYGIGQTFVFNQESASDTWTIHHGLGKYPSITVVDSAGTEVVGGIQYLDDNTMVVTFNGAFSGTAYLN